MYFSLVCDYVENVVERRAPFREAHLALGKGYVERGELVLGGAFDAPVDGAAMVFKTEDKAKVEEFVSQDPYVKNTVWSVCGGSAAGQWL